MNCYDASMARARKIPKEDNGFQRVRNDHATETAEDYVEAIAQIHEEKGRCRCADLARLFGVSHVTVVKIISRLQDEGLVVTKPYAPVTLTRRGRALASSARRRHEIVLSFLLAIGVDPATAAIDSEGIEHHVSEKTLECFQRLISESQNG